MNTIIDESNGDIHQIPFFKSFLPPSRGILLIDANAATLQNRATALRRLKMDVVCANTLSAARSHWHAGTYELVCSLILHRRVRQLFNFVENSGSYA
jgi:hypothetical protein